jgi:hypothetical protein
MLSLRILAEAAEELDARTSNGSALATHPFFWTPTKRNSGS